MVNDNLDKMIEVMGENNDCMFLKGQVKNIQKRSKETGEFYYLADIKVCKKINDSNYGISYDMYNVCFSADLVVSLNLDDEKMKSFKDNEVILGLTPSCMIKKVTKDNGENKYNRCNFFVNSFKQIDVIGKQRTLQKVYNL